MITMFGLWNGGTPQFGEAGFPELFFPFPPASPDLVQFCQVSGRVNELLTNAEWLLNFGGYRYDIPNLPAPQLEVLLKKVETDFGHVPQSIPFQLTPPNAAPISVPLIVWADLRTGRADAYSPATGIQQGPTLLEPRPDFTPGEDIAKLAVGSVQEGKVSKGRLRKAFEIFANAAMPYMMSQFMSQQGSGQGGAMYGRRNMVTGSSAAFYSSGDTSIFSGSDGSTFYIG